MMKGYKTSFEIRIDDNLEKELDKIVEKSRHLDITRSEVVEAILKAYFKSNTDHTKKARELVIQKRKGKI